MLTDEELRDAWEDGCSEEEIAETYSVPLEEVRYRRKKILRLRKKPKKWEPTPEEIAEATARIQESWTPAMRAARLVSPKPSWAVPAISLSDTGLDEFPEE